LACPNDCFHTGNIHEAIENIAYRASPARSLQYPMLCFCIPKNVMLLLQNQTYVDCGALRSKHVWLVFIYLPKTEARHRAGYISIYHDNSVVCFSSLFSYTSARKETITG
jgi:hypothetical protein